MGLQSWVSTVINAVPAEKPDSVVMRDVGMVNNISISR